jgi:WD40 repeat protein
MLPQQCKDLFSRCPYTLRIARLRRAALPHRLAQPALSCMRFARWVWDAVFSVDAAYLVTASSDMTARLWDLSSGESIRTYTGHHRASVCCALNDSAIDGREGADG